MKANVKVDTRPEIAIRSALHRMGFRFRKNVLVWAQDVRVRPDIVFSRQQVAVFVDGCFWHSCPDHGVQPRKNARYWGAKLARNLERDKKVTEALQNSGWTVVRIWEHDEPVAAARKVSGLLRDSNK